MLFPLACQVICRGPAFTGMRHFLFVVPALAVLAGIGLDAALTALATRGRALAAAGLAVVAAGLLLDAVTLVRLHPYEYLFYNSAVGGLEGASRRYDLDYWFGSMPEALDQLEAYLRRTEPVDAASAGPVYSVAVCGERLEFDKNVTLPQLRWDFRPQWHQSEFFIAPTQMNCDERSRRQGDRHRRTARRRHRLRQGPPGADPAGGDGDALIPQTGQPPPAMSPLRAPHVRDDCLYHDAMYATADMIRIPGMPTRICRPMPALVSISTK